MTKLIFGNKIYDIVKLLNVSKLLTNLLSIRILCQMFRYEYSYVIYTTVILAAWQNIVLALNANIQFSVCSTYVIK
jgi:hypothetical protein